MACVSAASRVARNLKFLQIPENQGAVAYFEEQVDRDPGNPDKYLYLALAHYQLQDWDRAAWAATYAIAMLAKPMHPN